MNLFSHIVAGCPIVPRARTILVDVKIFWIVNISIRPCLDAVYDAWFEVKQNSAGDISSVV
jgi:hypothetical protein